MHPAGLDRDVVRGGQRITQDQYGFRRRRLGAADAAQKNQQPQALTHE